MRNSDSVTITELIAERSINQSFTLVKEIEK